MGFFDDRENLGPPPEPFRMRTSEPRSPIPLKWVGVAAAVLVAYLAISTLKSLYVEYLWFDSVGYASVFRTAVWTRIVLFVAGAVITVGVLGLNIYLARRLAPKAPEESFIEEIDPAAIRRIMDVLLIAGVLFMAVIFGSVAGGSWETVLRWMNGVEFGITDPQFNRDVAYYMFDLPAYHFFHGWVLGLTIVSTLAAGAVYGLAYSLQRFELNITRGMRIHLSVLVGIIFLLIAISTYLSIFDLVTSEGGLIFGATYTDVNARLPIRYVLVVLALLVGVAAVANAVMNSPSYRLPLFAFGVWAFVGLVGGVIYPQAVQSFQVEPNEREREVPYILHNLDATREAWMLDAIDVRQHPAEANVTNDELDANPETLENIRLLDPVPLLDTVNQLQAIRPFYRFRDLDISRYPITDDHDRQVLIAARELDIGQAADVNWTRQRLQFTHGFGAVVTPVNEVQEEGLPVLLTQDIPPRSQDLPITIEGSRIYFGELTDYYVIVNSNEPEFDYPEGTSNTVTTYQPDRGIRLGGFFRRFLLSWELGDYRLMISSQIHDDSRLLMHRQIRERVEKVAPFLRLDSDPYLMIIDEELKWMQPAYTVSDRYPYSQPESGINYIRNSVQIVVDAETGDMDFYLIDDQDPIIQTWAGIFPDLFTPGDEMPEAIRQQLRYPLDMFTIQARHYQTYHITQPEVFFFGEDVWSIPSRRPGDSRPMEPYYVTMRLPGEDAVEFILIIPFTPQGRENTVGWLAGRSDGDHFGTMRAFRFPTDRLVFGPQQIENRIDQNARISQQLTLWEGTGSEIFRSTLMMIPVGDSFLYVQPVYLQAAGGQLPELRRVIVANGNNVAMEETFDRALEVVMGERAPSDIEGLPGGELPDLPGITPTPGTEPTLPPTTPTPLPPIGSIQELLDRARLSSEATQRELDELRSILDAIEQQLNQQQAP